MYFFTADQHFNHKNIIKYCNRPFSSAKEMDEEIIKRFNSVVRTGDTTVHAGDFSFTTKEEAFTKYLNRLNGNHVLLRGSHDRWMDSRYHEIWEKTIEGVKVVVCHYAMRTWAASHYNSLHLFGHSHGTLKPIGKSLDIGVDSYDFYPMSFDSVLALMEDRPDNPNLVVK